MPLPLTRIGAPEEPSRAHFAAAACDARRATEGSEAKSSRRTSFRHPRRSPWMSFVPNRNRAPLVSHRDCKQSPLGPQTHEGGGALADTRVTRHRGDNSASSLTDAHPREYLGV